MSKLPESTNITPDDLIVMARKGYIKALRLIIAGSIVAFLILLFAALPAPGGHTLRPNYFLLLILSFAIFLISCIISLILSGLGVIRGAVALSLKIESRDEIKVGIIKNITLMLGIFLLILAVYRLLT